MHAGTLNFLRSLSLSVGMAFATSCFGMIAGIAGATGFWMLPAIGASLLIVLAVARGVGRLARRFPSALGVRTYLKAAFGNTASLFFVFVYLVMIALVAGVESNLYASIVQQMAPAIEAHWIIPAVFAAVLALNVFGHEISRNAQMGLVLLMLGGVLSLSLSGIVGAGVMAWVGSDAIWPGGNAGWPGSDAGEWPAADSAAHLAALPTAVITAFFLFVGFEWVTSAQSGSRQAAAQLPRVLVAAVLLLGSVYLMFATAALLQLDAARLSATRTPQMLLAGLMWGEPGRWAMLLVSTAAVLMSFNAGVLGASRLVYGLAREGCLPHGLATTVGPRSAPVPAIAITVGLSLCFSLVAHGLRASDLLGGVAAVLVCLCYGALLSASLVLARRDRLTVAIGEAAALLAMVLLLVAMLFDPSAWHRSALAAGACAACLLCAGFANARVRAPSICFTSTST